MMPASVNNTPGPGPFPAAATSFGSGPGYHGQHYAGPPSTYALPSGLGAATGPYPPLNAHFAPTGPAMSAGPMDNRAVDAAFNNAAHGPMSAGPANGFYSTHSDDPFGFLASGLGGLTMAEDRGEKLNGDRTNKPAV